MHERSEATPVIVIRPEWLPLPGKGITPEIAVLTHAYFYDDLGELCAGMADRIRERVRVPDKVTWRRFTVDELQDSWRWYCLDVMCALVSYVDVGSTSVFQAVILFIDKATGLLDWIDPFGLLGEPTVREDRMLVSVEALMRIPAEQRNDPPSWVESETATKISRVPDFRG